MRGELIDRGSAGRVGLRASTPADEAFLTRVFASTRSLELALLAPDQAAAFVESQSRLQRGAYADRYPGCAFEIVVVDATPAGRLLVARGAAELRIVDVALLPEFRGAGIGTRVLGAVLDEAAARGVSVGLEVDLGNPARGLYEQLGFAVEASTETQVSMRWTPPGAIQVKTAS